MAGKRKRSVHQPRHFRAPSVATHGIHTPVRGIIHETISGNATGRSDIIGVGAFWQRQGLGYGAHIGLDTEGNSGKYAGLGMITWHTGGRNTGSLGFELVGGKNMDRAAWWKLGRGRQLHQMAKWMAFCNKEFGIPLRWDVERGWSSHFMQSKAFGTTDHTDAEFLPKKRLMLAAKCYRRLGW